MCIFPRKTIALDIQPFPAYIFQHGFSDRICCEVHSMHQGFSHLSSGFPAMFPFKRRKVTVLVDETTSAPSWDLMAGLRDTGGYADAEGDLPESRHERCRMVCGLASACQDGVSKDTGGYWRTMKDAGGLCRTHLWALGLGIYCKVL